MAPFWQVPAMVKFVSADRYGLLAGVATLGAASGVLVEGLVAGDLEGADSPFLLVQEIVKSRIGTNSQ